MIAKSVDIVVLFLSIVAADAQNGPAATRSPSPQGSPTRPDPPLRRPFMRSLPYATPSIPDFPVNALIAGADPQRKLSIAMTVWLIRGNGRVILVDSGFYRPQFFKQFKVDGFIKASEAVGQPGIMPAGRPALTATPPPTATLTCSSKK